MASWRVAGSLNHLLRQINAAYPGRSTRSDGSIGDVAHAARVSDHNPDMRGVVRARDFTNDPQHGFVSHDFAERLRKSRDPRIKYVISQRQMFSSYAQGGIPAWTWRHYSGKNPHTAHCHVSVVADDRAENTADWNAVPIVELIEGSRIPTFNVGDATGRPLLRRGARGPAVTTLQQKLGVAADGIFGPNTDVAVRRFQAARRLAVDGIVGPDTWEALYAPPPTVGLAVDGDLGPNTVKALQRVLGVAQDGWFRWQSKFVPDLGPTTSRALQRALGVSQDGDVGPNTIRALQRRLGVSADGKWGSGTTRALQTRLNEGRL